MTQNLSDYEGEILYDNVSLKEIDPESFISNVGYVRQEHFIFHDSIKNNIILNKAFNKEKFIQVLKQSVLYEEPYNAKADHFYLTICVMGDFW